MLVPFTRKIRKTGIIKLRYVNYYSYKNAKIKIKKWSIGKTVYKHFDHNVNIYIYIILVYIRYN